MARHDAHTPAMGFDFELMVRAFERVHPAPPAGAALPLTRPFLDAMAEVVLLFEHLGTGFGFVRRDLSAKTAVLSAYAADNPRLYHDLARAVDAEVAAGAAAARGRAAAPSAARTVLRLMWALRFIDVLLKCLGDAFDPSSQLGDADRTLRWAVVTAYDTALADQHPWAVRRTVKAACIMLPAKEAFMERLGVDLSRREEYVERLGRSMTPLLSSMYLFYKERGLLKLT